MKPASRNLQNKKMINMRVPWWGSKVCEFGM